MAGYGVIVELADDGTYGAWSPELAGCVAAADDYDGCVALMVEAVAGHLAAMRAYGDPVPLPRTVGAVTVYPA